ncbi:MAG: hypothetical protein WCO00_18705, partial [Rhodospirillaceae bacterium]
MTGYDSKSVLLGLLSPQRRPVLPLLVFAAGALVTLAAWQGRINDDHLRGQTRFDGAVRVIQGELNHYQLKLVGLGLGWKP